MCRVTRHHTRKLRISIQELDSEARAKLGIHDIRHYVHSRALRYLGYVFRMDADRIPIIPSLLQRRWVVDGNLKQHSGTKSKPQDLYDSEHMEAA
jgi:hypothetical protein